jgi:hypothetical protein
MFDDISEEELSDDEIKKQIAKQARRLRSWNAKTRRDAVDKLSDLCRNFEERACAAIPMLITLLGHADGEVRESAEHALSYCGGAALGATYSMSVP